MANEGASLAETFHAAVQEVKAIRGRTVLLDASGKVPEHLRGELARVRTVSFQKAANGMVAVNLGVRDISLVHEASVPLETVVTIADDANEQLRKKNIGQADALNKRMSSCGYESVHRNGGRGTCVCGKIPSRLLASLMCSCGGSTLEPPVHEPDCKRVAWVAERNALSEQLDDPWFQPVGEVQINGVPR